MTGEEAHSKDRVEIVQQHERGMVLQNTHASIAEFVSELDSIDWIAPQCCECSINNPKVPFLSQ